MHKLGPVFMSFHASLWGLVVAHGHVDSGIDSIEGLWCFPASVLAVSHAACSCVPFCVGTGALGSGTLHRSAPLVLAVLVGLHAAPWSQIDPLVILLVVSHLQLVCLSA